jgi:hypothetical protein
LKENNLSFPQMKKAQDVVFLWKATLAAMRMQSIDEIAYAYRVNPYSVGAKKLKAVAFFSERILFASEIVKMLEDSRLRIDETIRMDMEKTVFWCANSNIPVLKNLPKEELDKYFFEMVKHGYEIKNIKPYFNRKNRFLYSSYGGLHFWLLKVKLLKLK